MSKAEAAEALLDERMRAAMGRLVSRMVRPRKDHDPLIDAMERLAAEATRRGLTQTLLDKELALYHAERRGNGATGH
jgi:hypothetical protein